MQRNYGITGDIEIKSTVEYGGETYTVKSLEDYAFYYCSGLTNITIPNTVTSIGKSAFSGCSALKSINIPNGVVSIEENTFRGCTELKSIDIPNSVTSIGENAFNRCSGLISITIPESVNSIGENTFNYCSGLRSINVNQNNQNYSSVEGVLFDKNKTKLIQYPMAKADEIYTIPNTVTDIDDYSFLGCSVIKEIVLPDSVTTVGEYAFSESTSLSKINIPNKVTIIKNNTFDGCIGLTNITLSNTLTIIGEEAFAGCVSLTEITLPDSVETIETEAFRSSGLITITIPGKITKINDWVFWGCEGLTEITIPENVTYIGNRAFCGSGLTNITIPSNVKTIDECAFLSCENLKTIIIEDGVTSLGGSVFSRTGITEIKLPSTLDEISYRLFEDCESLKKVEIPKEIKTIGEYAFLWCSSLTEIKIPENVETIEANAFTDCTGLAKVIIPEGVEEIGYDAFRNCSNDLTIYGCPGSTAETYANNNSINFVNIEEIVYEYDRTNKTASVINNNLYGNELVKNVEISHKIVNENDSETYTVTSIENGAFSGYSSLEYIIIPETVTEIGSSAFENCSDNLIIYGYEGSIAETYANENNINFIPFAELVYEYDETNKIATIKKDDSYVSGLTGKIVIPTEVIREEDGEVYKITSIGNSAFYSCENLEAIEIFHNITTMGYEVFRNCQKLTDINVVEENSNFSSLDGVLFNKDKTEIIQYPSGKTDESYTFPSTVKTTESYAFAHNTNIKSVVIPEGVTEIGGWGCFWNCYGLENVELPSTIKSIGTYMFRGCSKLEKIVIPEGITGIGSNAFEECFGLKEIRLPETLKTIGYAAFYRCSGLTELDIPDSVTSIGNTAFSDCSKLTTINIPEGITGIYNWTFQNCRSLVEITIPESVTKIEYGAFRGCNKLGRISIPEKVTSIEFSAFENCTDLTEAIININDANKTNKTTWENNIFKGCNENLKIYVRLGSSAQNYAIDNNLIYEVIDVAKIEKNDGTYGYLTIDEAISNSNEGEIINLLKDINEDVTIETTNNVTIDGQIESEDKIGTINGKITNNGNVTLKNIIVISETVALENKAGAIVNLESETTLKGKEKAINSDGTINIQEGCCLIESNSEEYEIAVIQKYYTLKVNPNGGTWRETKEITTINSVDENGIYKGQFEIEDPIEPEGYTITLEAVGGELEGETRIKTTKTFEAWETNGVGVLDGSIYTFEKANGEITAKYINDTVELQTPTKIGYTFAGWYTDENYDETSKIEGNKCSTEKDITLYAKWVPKGDLSYTVNYLEKDTNKVISTAKTVESQVFGTEIQVSNEVKEIAGYNYDSVSAETITIGMEGNVINIYYTAREDLSYTVNYLEKGTSKVISAAKTVENQVFGTKIQVSNEVKEIEGYNYYSVSAETITIEVEGNVINIYYTPRTDLSYTVNYLKKGTDEILHNAKTVENQVFGKEVTETAIHITGYKAVAETATVTIGLVDNVINIYYVESIVENIAVTKMPNKTEYKADESFNQEGMEITATYDNGETRTLEETEYKIEVNNPLTIKDKIVSIIYNGNNNIKTDLEIIVNKAEGTGNPEVKEDIEEMRKEEENKIREEIEQEVREELEGKTEEEIQEEINRRVEEELERIENEREEKEAETGKEIISTIEVTYYEGMKLKDVSLPENWAWKEPEKEVYANEEGEVYIVIYHSKDENYEDAEAGIIVKIKKAIPKYELPAEIEAIKGQTLRDIKDKLAEGYEFIDALNTKVGEIGYREFKVRYIPQDINNYQVVENIPVIIHVVEGNIPVAEITIIEEMRLVVGGKATLTADIIPEEVTNKELIWRSSNEGIVVVDREGNVEAKEEGVAYVIVEAAEGGKTASCRIEVIEKTYEVEETEEGIYVSNINPNTTKEIFEEKFPSIYRMEICNQKGEGVKEGEIIGTGYTLNIYDGEELKEERINLIVKGDVTGEGTANYIDSGKIIYHRLGKELLEGVFKKAADISGDGIINGQDSTILIYHRLKMDGYKWEN